MVADPGNVFFGGKNATDFDCANHTLGSIRESARLTALESAGRTRRPTSIPSFRNTKVGQSFTLNERPNGRPLPSSTRKCRTSGCANNASYTAFLAARQCPHQSVPNSNSVGPLSASMSARDGAVPEYPGWSVTKTSLIKSSSSWRVTYLNRRWQQALADLHRDTVRTRPRHLRRSFRHTARQCHQTL